MKSLYTHIKDTCYTEDLTAKEKKLLVRIYFGYVLGLTTYSAAYKEIRGTISTRKFSQSIRALTEKQIEYILFKLRRQAKFLDRKIVGISKKDRFVIEKLASKLPYENVWLVRTFPSLTHVIQHLHPHVYNLAKSAYKGVRFDSSIAREDIVSELKWKIAQAYKLYIFSFGQRNFNEKVFYSCVLKGAQTKRLDLISSRFNDKRVINMYASDTEELADNKAFSCQSVEDTLIQYQEVQKAYSFIYERGQNCGSARILFGARS